MDQIVTKKPRSDASMAVWALEDSGDHLTGADERNQLGKEIRRHDRYFTKHASSLYRVENGNAITGSNVEAAERLMALEKRQGSAVSLFFRLVIFDRSVDCALGTRLLYGRLER